MKNEFKEFEKEIFSSNSRAPTHLSRSILDRVHFDLKPTFTRVLAKLGILHAGASILTLSVCHQRR
jgi:hypothetical protein